MSHPTSPSSSPNARASTPTSAGTDDQLHLLTLCLELQLDLLFVALRSTSQPMPRWVGENLDLTGISPPLRPSPGAEAPAGDDLPDEWLVARYSGLMAAVDGMLENSEVRRHPALLARLQDARASCDERLAGALARIRVPAARSAPSTADAPTAPSAMPMALDAVEPGHFLG